uniref:Uncharacterized protein n=1 Tax=Kalanchoe fedtschenkoi TaxID=63787 RepID=A0A7N0ULT9_KALFE
MASLHVALQCTIVSTWLLPSGTTCILYSVELNAMLVHFGTSVSLSLRPSPLSHDLLSHRPPLYPATTTVFSSPPHRSSPLTSPTHNLTPADASGGDRHRRPEQSRRSNSDPRRTPLRTAAPPDLVMPCMPRRYCSTDRPPPLYDQIRPDLDRICRCSTIQQAPPIPATRSPHLDAFISPSHDASPAASQIQPPHTPRRLPLRQIYASSPPVPLMTHPH